MKVKKLTALLLAALLVALAGCGYTSEDLEERYSAGYEDGYNAAKEKAKEDSSTAYDSGYAFGYDDGYDDGLQDGHAIAGWEAETGHAVIPTEEPAPTPKSTPTPTPTPQPTPQPAPQPTPQPTPEPQQPVQTEATVYVTNSGSKYHNAGCRYLWNSSIAMSLSDAKASGYTACSVCNPPA